MDPARFDRLVRSFGPGSSRRRLITGLFASALGAGAAGLVPSLTAGKKKKIKKNQFGCVNVGKKCRGKDGKCCSGICKGKKPGKGEKDKSECKAHDTGVGCVAGQRSIFCSIEGPVQEGFGSEGMSLPNCTSSAGLQGGCETTTGNAPYCAVDGLCFRCSKDTDCQATSVCGPGAACIQCKGCGETGGTACVSAIEQACPLPVQT